MNYDAATCQVYDNAECQNGHESLFLIVSNKNDPGENGVGK